MIIRIFKFWYRINELEENSLLKETLDVQLRAQNTNKIQMVLGGGGGWDLTSSLEAKFGAMKPIKIETFEIKRQNLGYLSSIFGTIRPNSRKRLDFKSKIWDA